MTEEPFTLQQMAAPPRRRTGLIVAIAAGAVVLVAATIAVTTAVLRDPSPQQQAAAATAAPTTSSATTPGTATTPPTQPTPGAAQGPRKLGEKADGERSTSVAHTYRQPVAKNAAPPDQDGFEWGAADVEVCVKSNGTLHRESWRLVYADHTTIDPSGVGYGQFPEPKYPWDDREVTVGQCIRGWITYPVPVGKRPALIQYQPDGRTVQAEWAVS